ncbi:MAG: mechanosensitive ion channel [Deltaproteobacteria bacterium]|jgi:small-conductance mechanosensitive channel|nr:mechanosensitive ion channel [Deltaproteobacteria bacterium]
MKTARIPSFAALAVLALLALLAASVLILTAPDTARAQDPAPSAAEDVDAASADAPSATSDSADADAQSGDAAPELPVLPDLPGITVAAVPEESVFDDLSKLTKSLTDLAADISQDSGKLKPYLTSTAETMTSLLRTYQKPGARPIEQEDILRQLRGLRSGLAEAMATLDDRANTLTQRRNELNLIKASAKDVSAAPSGDRERIGPFLAEAESLYESTSASLDGATAPAKALLESLDGYIKRYSTEIPQAWKAYYFTESRLLSLKLPALTGEGGYFSEWYAEVTSKQTFVYPQTPEDWGASLAGFLMTAVLVAFLGFLLYRGAHLLPVEPVNWRGALLEIVRGPWIFLNLGLALLNASRNQLGGSYLFFSIPGVLILIWALASISWKLRLAAKPDLAGQKSPLTRFYPPAALGVLLLFADVPAGALSILWFVIMGLFIIQLRKLNRHRRAEEAPKLLLLERFAYGSAVYFAVISLVIALLGYPRLAILAFMIQFTLVNVLILGNSFAELGSILCNRIFPLDTDPVKYSILNAFLIPVTWSLSLFCTIPWFLAIPGSSSLLKSFMTTGYSIGDASFDLTKVLLILGLFFMFRSLKNLGRTSLEHLPDELKLGKNVIMPIQTLLTYVVWAIFAVIVMGLLGVNWTSLAVAASGLGLGLGIGLQNIFTNVVSGVILIFGRTIQIGDFVEVGGISGTVKSVDFRCTLVETSDSSLVYVPNSTILSSQFINWTRNGRQVRRTMVIRAFYGTDTDLARNLILDSVQGTANLGPAPNPLAILNDLNEKYLEFNLLVTIGDIDNSSSVLSDLRLKIEKSFKEHGIKLYRQSLDINFREALRGLQAGQDGPGGPAMAS